MNRRQESAVSRQEKLLLGIALALFAIAHIGGAFVLQGAQATPQAPAALIQQGD
jgi:hypothetical protein